MNLPSKGPITGHTYLVSDWHDVDSVMDKVSHALENDGFEDDWSDYNRYKKFKITITVEQV